MDQQTQTSIVILYTLLVFTWFSMWSTTFFLYEWRNRKADELEAKLNLWDIPAMKQTLATACADMRADMSILQNKVQLVSDAANSNNRTLAEHIIEIRSTPHSETA